MTDHQRFNLAFSAIGGAGWLGGLNYVKNILVALNSLDKSERPRLVMLVPAEYEKEALASLMPLLDEVLVSPSGKGSFAVRLQNKARKHKRDIVMGQFLRRHKIDCLFQLGHRGPDFPVPLLSWIPDFQHLHLAEMFSPQEVEDRNREYAETARFATRVVVTSEDVKNDFQHFAPASANKVRVISGVSQVPVEIYETNPEWVCREYHLPQKFFYVPNQFWKHKNHAIILDALMLLQAAKPEITVVCTGNIYDDRHPRYSSELLTRIARQGLRNNFLMLGMIPQPHTLQLIRQSLAVLQPSQFEGWSNAVAEAKSVGKPIILSNIPTHCEHNPSGAIFFDPHDAAELAKIMQTLFDHGTPGPHDTMEEAARKALHSRTQQFGREFAAIAREAAA